jgi:hypothetical protein
MNWFNPLWKIFPEGIFFILNQNLDLFDTKKNAR